MKPTSSNKMRDYLVPAHGSVRNFLNNSHPQLRCKGNLSRSDKESVAKILSNIEKIACELCEKCERSKEK